MTRVRSAAQIEAEDHRCPSAVHTRSELLDRLRAVLITACECHAVEHCAACGLGEELSALRRQPDPATIWNAAGVCGYCVRDLHRLCLDRARCCCVTCGGGRR